MLEIRFPFDRAFRIAQLTDLCLADPNGIAEHETLRFLERLFAEEKPDLVVVTGGLAEPPLQAELFRLFCDFMDRQGIRWAFAFGDRDRSCAVPARALESILLASRTCLYERGDPHVHGEGNYGISLCGADQAPRWLLYLLDSGSESGAPYMAHTVIGWCRRARAAAPEDSRLLYFFHRPLPEFSELMPPERKEAVAETPLNSGFFASAAADARSAGIFAGQPNGFGCSVEKDGIRCAYGVRSGVPPYGAERPNAARGWRTILLPAQSGQPVETYARSDAGQSRYP